MNKEAIKLGANFLLFLIGWFLCVLGTGSIALYVTCTILFIHFITIGNWKKEKEVLAVSVLLGSTIDSFLGNMNILQFSGEGRILPMWLACIWVLLGTTIRHSLAWTGKHWALAAGTGLICGPVGYYTVSQLTDMNLNEPLWQTLLILAIIWALTIPLLQAFSRVWQKRLDSQTAN